MAIRWPFISPNSQVVTALFDILNGDLAPDSGSLIWGKLNTYLPQDHKLSLRIKTLASLIGSSTDQNDSYIRGWLGRMLFSGEEGIEKCRCPFWRRESACDDGKKHADRW